ncbi:hypothetical protein ACH5RR_018413 [Cinchona calisaya]|uniref:Uncharacterized protein n=1 Tax=Cinchona calisaya TaxID=153742 RepID=A0ABD2ZMA0_9GENT
MLHLLVPDSGHPISMFFSNSIKYVPAVYGYDQGLFKCDNTCFLLLVHRSNLCNLFAVLNEFPYFWLHHLADVQQQLHIFPFIIIIIIIIFWYLVIYKLVN